MNGPHVEATPTRPHERRVHRFTGTDRALLASAAGVGNRVIERLEQAGYHTLAQMKAAGAGKVVDAVCSLLGSTTWRNRRRALERAMGRAASDRPVVASTMGTPIPGSTHVLTIDTIDMPAPGPVRCGSRSVRSCSTGQTSSISRGSTTRCPTCRR
jgi:hypothetical protein